MRRVKVNFHTDQFEISHGKKPRGRGSWVFECPTGNQILIKGSLTLAEAKKAFHPQAVQIAIGIGVDEIDVEVCLLLKR